MKKRISLILATFFIFLIIQNFAFALTDITNCTDLQNMKNNLSENYRLINNIDCSDTINWNNGSGFEPIGNYSTAFIGTFDGQKYNISNLYINYSSDGNIPDFFSFYIGLFGWISNSEIKNVGLINEFLGCELKDNTNGSMDCGGLVAYNYNSTIDNSFSIGNYIAYAIINSMGGLVGNGDGIINNSYVLGNITIYNSTLAGGTNTGILAGAIHNIYNSYAIGNIYDDNAVFLFTGGLTSASLDNIKNSYAIVNMTCYDSCGGLVGYTYSSTYIENSYAIVNLNGLNNNCGGLVGNNNGIINNSYAIGNVSCISYAGGLVGNNRENGNIINSYSTTLVNGDTNVGGLVGNSTIDCSSSNSFYDNQTSNQTSSACGTGHTTAEMKTLSLYSNADWNIIDICSTNNNIWKINNTNNYPCLNFQQDCICVPIIPTISPAFPNEIQYSGSSDIFSIMKSASVGTYWLLHYIKLSLPILLILLALVGIIIIIGKGLHKILIEGGSP